MNEHENKLLSIIHHKGKGIDQEIGGAMDFELRAATAKLEREQRERKEIARRRLERERKAKAEAAIQRDAIDSARRIKRIEEARVSQLVLFFFSCSFDFALGVSSVSYVVGSAIELGLGGCRFMARF